MSKKNIRKIFVSDFTLKKLAGERKNPLLFREKTALAGSVDSFGVDAIELPSVKNSKEDRIINKTISSQVKNASVCIPVGFTEDSLNDAFACISEANSPCLQVELPVSTVQMEYQYHMKSDKMLKKICELTKLAKEKCNKVEFVALDATRADLKFLKEAIKAAEESGATLVTLCDDAGVFLPDEFASLVKEIKDFTSVPVCVRVSDSLNMATATAIACVIAGADGVKTVVTGKNELSEDKFMAAVSAKGDALKITTGLDVTSIGTDVRSLSNRINSTEAVASESIENKENIFLDSNSTLEQVEEAAGILGYSLSEEDCGKVLRALQRVCKKKSNIGAKELEAVIAANAMQVPSTYHLESYSVSSSNLSAAMANVVLIKGTKSIVGVATGDGPIDAAFRAIEQSIGFHYELDEFQIQAVTGGKEALGSALVRLRNDGTLYSGNGLSTDIVAASIRAYINALNKIVYEED